VQKKNRTNESRHTKRATERGGRGRKGKRSAVLHIGADGATTKEKRVRMTARQARGPGRVTGKKKFQTSEGKGGGDPSEESDERRKERATRTKQHRDGDAEKSRVEKKGETTGKMPQKGRKRR